MNEQIIIMDQKKFNEIYQNEKLRNAVAFAHKCLNSNYEFMYKKALMYPVSYSVTQDQINRAKDLRIKKQKEFLEENKNNLLFVGMGMTFKSNIEDGIGNHRIRTCFLNGDGVKCFIEVGTGRDENLRIDHATFNHKENVKSLKERDEETYNYKNLESKTPILKYTYENVLKLVNNYFNCSFKKIIIDNYNVECNGLICSSKKVKIEVLN